MRLSDPVQGEVTRSYILHLPASYNPANTAATPLLLDYHGYTASANLQLLLFPWRQVADRDETGGVECQRMRPQSSHHLHMSGFIYVAMDGMSDVPEGGRRHGSWNCSSSSGPLGPTCDLSVIPSYPCYASCAASSPQGDCTYLENSCDW